MLILTLLRHAKAVTPGRGDDFARALADKGRQDAERLGAYLAGRGWWPDLALVSAAVRTRQTFEIVEGKAGRRIPAQLEPALYNATGGQLRDVLKLVDPALRHLMIVGHSPGIMDAAIMLARDGDLLDVQRLRNRFPPGALARVEFDAADWLDARASGGRLDALLLPDDLVAPD